MNNIEVGRGGHTRKKFSDEYKYSTEKIVSVDGNLKGIGTCCGRVKSKVRIVINSHEMGIPCILSVTRLLKIKNQRRNYYGQKYGRD